jgi:hypothetical protein
VIIQATLFIPLLTREPVSLPGKPAEAALAIRRVLFSIDEVALLINYDTTAPEMI